MTETEKQEEARRLRVLAMAALGIVDHPKLSLVSAAAAWLWMQSLVLTVQTNAGGIITTQEVKALGGLRRVPELIASGLWAVAPGGWKMRSLHAAIPAIAPAVPVEPVAGVLDFVTVGDGRWPLVQSRLDSWAAIFPFDVLGECRKAGAWLDANPSRRKTGKGMHRFLLAWLMRVNDRGRATVLPSASVPDDQHPLWPSFVAWKKGYGAEADEITFAAYLNFSQRDRR